jgi:hypothetical protein
MITTVKKTSSAFALEETKVEAMGFVSSPVKIFVMSATQPK